MQTLFFEWLLPLTAAGTVVSLLLTLLSPLTMRRLSARWNCLGWCLALFFFIVPIHLPAPAMPMATLTAEMAQWPAAFSPQASGLLAAKGLRPVSLTVLLPWLWLLGAALLALSRLAAAARFSRSLRACCTPEHDPAVLSLYAHCRATLNIGRDIPLLRCDRIVSPMLVGILRPYILLPNGPLEDNRLELMLRHELIHLCRGDLPRKLAALIVHTLHWFNPLSWLLVRRLNLLCELACDEAIVRGMDLGARRSYGDAILTVAGKTRFAPPVSTSFSQSYKQLKRRLFTIMNPKKSSRWLLFAGICTTALLVYTGVTVSSFALADRPEAAHASLSIALQSPIPDALYSNRFGGDANHMGLDLIAKEGTRVLAAAQGTVVAARPIDPDAPSPYGNYLVLDHGDGIKTLYGHCSELLVKEGDQVQAGALIARVGQTGQTTGPNLHFELRLDGKFVDPQEHLPK